MMSGFASVGSNNGHNGTSGAAFYQNPEVVTDFAWRAYVSSPVLLEFVDPNFRTLKCQR
jgi:feruloyl esterase